VNETRLEKLEPGRVRVVGDLTFGTISAVLGQSDTLGDGPGRLEIDLSGVHRADSAGLALLVHWLREAHRSGRDIVFHNLPRQMLAIARVSDLEDILPRGEA